METETRKHPIVLSLRWKCLGLTTFSFLIPLLIILVALIGLHITPFGDKTLVISDAHGLYINYLGYVARLIKGLECFTYSFEKGLGGNMMPHLGGTMSNPVFALIALFNIIDYPIAFTWISTLNFAMCGLTMYILLADVFGHKRSNLIFSTSYALSGFLVANVFQIIFFTGPQMLPLMLLGLRKLFQGKSPLLYILSLAYSLLTNAYFGFTLCTASVLVFFAKLWLDWDILKRQWLRLFIHYTIASLCGGLLAIFIWLPGFMGIMGGRLDQTKITDFSFWENMPFVEIFSKLFTGANSTSQLVDGLPNIFVGLLPIMLVVLFFMNKMINRRRKIVAGILLIIYLLSFYIVAFDMLMHAGTTTNWFNHRYSYIFSALLLLIAAYEWQYIETISFSDLKWGFVGMVIAALVVFSKRYEYVMGGEVILDFALLLLVFLAYRMFRMRPEKNPKHTFEVVSLLVICVSLFLNYTISTHNIMDWGFKESVYQKTVSAVAPLITGVQTSDHAFYRMEVNKQRSETTGNDPMLYGYNGVGHGGSNERDFVREELNKLGVQRFDMRNYYAQGIPAATDALLGIKYLIADEDIAEEKDYIRMTDMAKMGLAEEGEAFDLYKSDYTLPIVILSVNDLDDIKLTYDDIFDNLNRVWSAISDSEKRAFIEEDDIDFRAINLIGASEISANEAREITQSYELKSNISETSGDDTSSESDAGVGIMDLHLIMDEAPMFSSSIEFRFIARQDGPVYVYHRAALSDTGGSVETTVKYMGWYHEGEIVTGYLKVPGDYVNRIVLEEYAGRFRAAYADLDALRDMSEAVRQQPTMVLKEQGHDNHLTGNFTASKDETMLFTIPWDEGWTCWIDGERVKLEETLGVFMSTKVEPGEHTFEMKYVPAGLNAGIRISACTLVFTLLYLLFGKKWMDRLWAHRDAAREAVLAAQKEATADDSI